MSFTFHKLYKLRKLLWAGLIVNSQMQPETHSFPNYYIELA